MKGSVYSVGGGGGVDKDNYMQGTGGGHYNFLALENGGKVSKMSVYIQNLQI